MPPSTSPLPPLYDRWMRECLGMPLPGEPKATCSDCAMCPPKGAPATGPAVFYDPRSKCCTYMPTLWNFLAGMVLSDDSPEAATGRRSVEARIRAGVAVTPLGLERPPVYLTLYGHISHAFGRAQVMRCPHYIEEGGRCGVWRARESTCATWFCKHERGQLAKRFWQQLHRLLLVTERQTAIWCMRELAPGTAALAATLPFPSPRPGPVSAADFDGEMTPADRARIWGRWSGKEIEFYREAGRMVQALSWSEVRALGGAELDTAVEITRAYLAELSVEELPARLRVGRLQMTPEADGGAMVSTYSPIDPLRLSRDVLAVLPFFDGRTTRAARQAITRQLGFQVDNDLLIRLVDHGVLEDPERPAPPQP